MKRFHYLRVHGSWNAYGAASEEFALRFWCGRVERYIHIATIGVVL